MLKMFDLKCPCGHAQEALLEDGEVLSCVVCGQPMVRLLSSPTVFQHIIPTYPGSQRFKAGYAHKYVKRAAEKTQVGYGGGVSGGQ